MAWLRERRLQPRRTPCTAFVLSGGGNMGALQVGMLRALFERSIRPDLVLGCSVGALNGAAVAAEPSAAMVDRLESLWVDLERSDVLPSGLLPTTVHMARRGVSVHGNDALRAVMEEVLSARTFEELTLPFQCVATAIADASERWFDSGPLVEAILASAALPAVLPPVELDGVRYMDGAVVNDVPISRAVELGATTVFVLHVGAFDRPRPEPRRPVDMALQAYWIARRHRFRRDLAHLPPWVEAVILPTGEAPVLRFNDLAHSGELITIAHRATAAALDLRARRLAAGTPPPVLAGADGASAPAPEPAETVRRRSRTRPQPVTGKGVDRPIQPHA
jgi:NTE family protein